MLLPRHLFAPDRCPTWVDARPLYDP